MTPSWSDLPTELLGLVLLHLRCLANRVYFAAVCRSWRSAARALGPLPQLPWLLLPSADAPSFVSLLAGDTHRISLPDGIRGARLCGSHEGGWLTLAADGWRGYALFNLFSGAWVPLPDRISVPLGGYESCVIVRAVALSAAPTSQTCLAAALVCGTSNVAFLRPGLDRHWLIFGTIHGLHDILYYEGEILQGFHAITNDEAITVFKQEDARRSAALNMTRRYYRMRRRPCAPPFLSRYLVESRGKLLMVARYCPRIAYAEHGSSAGEVMELRTRGFDVFEMAVEVLPDGQHVASWVELDGLEGRVLFLARGCSRAFEASQFDGFKEGIYFLDDTSFDISLVLSYGRNYPCSDIGRYSRRNIAHGFQGFPCEFQSNCSSPTWLYP